MEGKFERSDLKDEDFPVILNESKLSNDVECRTFLQTLRNGRRRVG